jgi:glycine/D-amino acid oxidase-like deaminating enzyme
MRDADKPGSHIITVVTAEGGTEEHTCDALLLAAGPWTSQVAQTLGMKMSAAIFGLKAHSVLLEPTSQVDDSCLFMQWEGDPFAGEFELYPRLDGVYVCGCGESPTMVDEGPSDVKISKKANSCLLASAASVSSALEGAKVLRETACYLPVASTGAIVAGELQAGIFVATGHTCWGILNGPATGKGMAELIACGGGGAAELLTPFAPC